MEVSGLIQKIAAGEMAALIQLYDMTSRMVFGFALRVTGDRSAAEDVMVEVYRQARNRAGQFDPDRIDANGWLLSLARTCALDRRRLNRRDHAKPDRAESTATTSEPEVAKTIPPDIAAARTQILGALESLPAEQRTAVELAFYTGMSPGEIAAHLGQPRAAIKTRTRLGMLKLVDQLRKG